MSTANQQHGMIKRALHWTLSNFKLLVCKTLCLAYLGYVAAAWDPSSRNDISDIEQLHDRALVRSKKEVVRG